MVEVVSSIFVFEKKNEKLKPKIGINVLECITFFVQEKINIFYSLSVVDNSIRKKCHK